MSQKNGLLLRAQFPRTVCAILFLLAGMLILKTTPVARAATITVTNVNDSGAGSLRQAIIDAGNGDTINFSVTGTITLTSGELSISKNLTIAGPGVSILTISGNNTTRVFRVYAGSTIEIAGLTIINGSSSSAGGGLANDGTLTLTDVKVSKSSSSGWGGGISNSSTGNLALTRVTISDNNGSYSVGGGIANSGELTMTNVTISDNSVSYYCTVGGGGLANMGGKATLNNVTISGNTIYTNGGSECDALGGGIYHAVNSNLDLNNVTITNNRSSANVSTLAFGGGILSMVGTVNLKNTIFAGNTTSGSGPDCSTQNVGTGTLNSQGYNLIQNTSACVIGGDTTGNLTGQNPLLGPLMNNGGSTNTHGLLPGSPAINAGNPTAPGSGGNACLATDQRGVARPVSARCDIGAFEGVTYLLYLPLITR